jgi:hypothetical protein
VNGRKRVGEWRSLVAHLLWEQRVASSNLVSPTNFFKPQYSVDFGNIFVANAVATFVAIIATKNFPAHTIAAGSMARRIP